MKHFFAKFMWILPPAVFLLCLCLGTVCYWPWEAGALLVRPAAGGEWGDGYILAFLRAPRIAVAMLTGTALSVSGVALQGLLRNPLADPYIVGTSSGAALGAALAMVAGLGAGLLGTFAVPLAAFAGAALVMAAVFAMSLRGNSLQVETFLLSGVIVGAFCSAMVSFLMSVSGNDLQRIVLWLMGSLSGREEWSFFWMMLPYTLAGVLMLYRCAPAVNLLSLGEEIALSRGVDVRRTKGIIIVFSSLLTACAVSVAGTIGFVGFIVPHIVRGLFGGENRKLVYYSAVLGGCFLALADTFVRSFPAELPVGVVTALCGAPFFLLVLRRTRP